MTNVKYTISLDVLGTSSQAALSMKQHDTARIIIASFRSGSVPFLPGDDVSAIFAAVKPDGHIIYNSCTVENGKVIYDITDQTTIVPGSIPCEIRLFDANNHMITSPMFTIVVSESACDDETVTEASTDEVTALTQLISSVTAIMNATDGLREEIQSKLDAGEFVGEQGPQGIPGPTGETGPQGVKGDAYVLTSEDKSDIADLMMNQLTSTMSEGDGIQVNISQNVKTKVIKWLDFTTTEEITIGGDNDTTSFGDVAINGRHWFYKTDEGVQLKALRIWGYIFNGSGESFNLSSAQQYSVYYEDGTPDGWGFGDHLGANLGFSNLMNGFTLNNDAYRVFNVSADLSYAFSGTAGNLNWAVYSNTRNNFTAFNSLCGFPHISGVKIASSSSFNIPAGMQFVVYAEVIDE